MQHHGLSSIVMTRITSDCGPMQPGAESCMWSPHFDSANFMVKGTALSCCAPTAFAKAVPYLAVHCLR